jgi:hypothetical protein
VPDPVQPQQIDLAICEKLIDSATLAATSVFKSCVAPQTGAAQPVQIPSASVDFNPLANSFAALSASIGYTNVIIAGITLLVAVIGLIAGFMWARSVAHEAKALAREFAEKEISAYIKKWDEDVAPGIVRKHLELVQNRVVLASGLNDQADVIGEQA